MPKQIIIFLNSSATADWAIYNRLGHRLAFKLEAPLSELKMSVEEADELIAFIPAQDLLLTEITLPALSRRRLEQTLPYALEEQVLEPIEELHFAPGPYQADRGLPVAVINKKVLEKWLMLLKTAELKVAALLPMMFALQHQEKVWQIAVRAEQAIIRTGAYSGFGTELANLETMINLKTAEEKNPPLSLVRTENAEELFESAALALKQEANINLLQGPYRAEAKLKMATKNKKLWKIAGLCLFVWLGFLLLNPLGSLIILTNEQNHLQHSIAKSYSTQKDLTAQLTTAKSNQNIMFLHWLGIIARSADSIQIQALNFQNNQLSLELRSTSAQHLDAFIKAVKAEGLQVTQQRTDRSAKRVKAVVLIERAS